MKTISKRFIPQPTSSTSSKSGFLAEFYNGQWMMPVYATRGIALFTHQFTHHAKSANDLIVAIRNNLLGEQ